MPRLILSLFKFLDVQLDHNLLLNFLGFALDDLIRFQNKKTPRNLSVLLFDPLPNIEFQLVETNELNK